MKKFTIEELSWAFYDWANSAFTLTITTAILPIYFKMVAERAGMSMATSTAYWGYTASASTLIISLMGPILGTLADYDGNKKRLLKVFLYIGLLSTIFLAFVPDNKPLGILVVFGISVIGYAGANVFYDSFIVDVTEDERMDKVSSLGFGLGYVGSAIPFIISLAIVILAQTKVISISIELACKISFILTALWWGVFSIPLLKVVQQKYYIEKEKNIFINSFKRIIETFKEIKEYRSIILFLIAYFFYIDGVHTIIGMSSAYGTDLGITMTSLLVILLLTQFVAFPCTLIYGLLAEKFGAKKMLYVGITTYTAICIYAYFLKTTFDFWVLAMAVGSAQGGIQAISRSYFAKLVPKEKSSEFFGFYSIFGKFAAIMGPMLVALFTQFTGQSRNGVISLVILFLIGGVILSIIK